MTINVCFNKTFCGITWRDKPKMRLDFLRLVYNSREVPADELLVSSLRLAAQARPEAEREPFLIGAGRELARLMGADPVRLEALLGRLGRVVA